jgi:hypothetical protein
MYFGRSIFQSVVERLESETAKASQEDVPAPYPRTAINTSFVFETALNDDAASDPSQGASQMFSAFDLDGDEAAALPPQDAGIPAPNVDIVEPIEAPQPETKATAAIDSKDYSFLSKTSHDEVRLELRLDTLTNVNALQAKRRQFARDNHPDTVPDGWRDFASLRMTTANLLIDQAVKDLALRKKLGL